MFGSDLDYDNSKKNGVLFDIADIGIESCFCTILFNIFFASFAFDMFYAASQLKPVKGL